MDFESLFILILAEMQYKLNDDNIFKEVLVKMTTTMNLIIAARFFKTICYNIFEYLLATSSKNRGVFGLISTYFSRMETNS